MPPRCQAITRPAYLDGAAAAHRGQDFHASQSPIASKPHEPMTPIVGLVGPVQRRLSIPQPHRHINASAAMDARTVLDIATRVSVALARVIWFPISKAINLVIILLLPFYNVITFFLLPFIHLGQAIIRVLSIPFSVKWLERIEVISLSSPSYIDTDYTDTIRLPRNSQPYRMHHRHRPLCYL